MRRICHTAFVAVTLIAAATSSGAVNYSSQARSVYAEAGFGSGPTQMFSAMNFDNFHQSAIVNDAPNMGGAASALQNSWLWPTQITNVSTLSASDGNQSSRGTARSLFTATFSVDAPTPWSFSGSWLFGSSNAPTGAARGTLLATLEVQGGGTLYSLNYDSWLANPSVLSGVFSGSGTLQPGNNYIFTLNMTETVQVISGTGGGNGNLNATLSFVPAPSAAALLGLGGLIAGRRRRA